MEGSENASGVREDGIITLEEVVAPPPEKPVMKPITLLNGIPDEPVRPMPGRDAAETLLKRLLADTKFVKGYRAAAVVNENGRILAADSSDDALNWTRLAGELSWFFKDAVETAGRIEFGPPDALTLHTTSGTVLLQQVELAPGVPACIVLVSSLQANWYYFKVRLENQKPKPKGPRA